MPKIDITSIDEIADREETFEKIRSRKPKQVKEKRIEKKNHREHKFVIWDLPEDNEQDSD